MAYVRFYEDLRLKEKRANERMRQLEKAKIKSPAYQAVQAKLEILGKQTKGNRGRRFSETGKATYNEMEALEKILNDFLGNETSTLRGAKKYREDTWQTANKNNKLTNAGIDKDDWFDFWENLPDKKSRLYDSEEYVSIIRAYSLKKGELEDDDKMTIEQITEEIESSKNLKDAYKRLGLKYGEVKNARISRIKAATAHATSRGGIAEV